MFTELKWNVNWQKDKSGDNPVTSEYCALWCYNVNNIFASNNLCRILSYLCTFGSSDLHAHIMRSKYLGDLFF